ncbi:MAG: hydrogenase iron-sulfur subunit, partial [Chloroflexi bacterium]|nr:hydrogenase iron-sulfur subunit [Chloroflexota bacterium]
MPSYPVTQLPSYLITLCPTPSPYADEDEATLQAWQRRPSTWATWLEKIGLVMEKPANQLIGNTRLNPFYHTGAIAVFLLLVVGGTGFYLFLFFHYGFWASYDSVAQYDNQFIARTMRAVHRYASGALVITTMLHAYRTLFLEQFRGPRWLAWVTGIVLTIIFWLAGVTGYWLVWDTRAQLINDSFIRFLNRFTPWETAYVMGLIKAEMTDKSWPILLIILAVHVLLFLIAAGFFWLHVRRLQRPQWFPELHWMAGMSIVLAVAAIAFPLTMLPQADPTALPQAIHLDPIFLFFLPAAGNTAIFMWIFLLIVTAVAFAFPWLSRDRSADPKTPTAAPPKVNIIKDRCTGCTLCALDCPYDAIKMVERQDGKRHKYVAIEDPSLCVSCGICVGSCDWDTVTMGDDLPPDLLWDEAAMRLTMAQAKSPDQPVRLIFTCERHAAQGAKPFIEQNNQHMEIITLPCVGTILPDVLIKALDAGAADIQVIGCPPEDCRNREGNVWTAHRLRRKRLPRLKRDYAQAPITAVWAAPNEFAEALQIEPVQKMNEVGETEPDYMASRRLLRPLTWRNYVVAFVLLLLVL